MNVWTDDATLYDSFFEVVIRSTLVEEEEWYNTTQIKLNYQKPTCELLQEEIDAVAGEQPSLFLQVTRGIAPDFRLSYADTVLLA